MSTDVQVVKIVSQEASDIEVSPSRGVSFMFWFVVGFFLVLLSIYSFSDKNQVSLGQHSVPIFVSIVGDSGATLNGKDVLTAGSPLKVGDVVSTVDTLEFQVFQESTIRVAPQSTFRVLYADDSPGKSFFTLQLLQGRVWVSSLFAHTRVMVMTDSVVFSADNSVFDVSSRPSDISVSVQKHFVRATLLAWNKDSNLPEYINEMLIAEGNFVTFKKSDVIRRLATLLYSKLTKIFPETYVPGTDGQDDWIKSNTDLDNSHNVEFLLSREQFLQKREGKTHFSAFLPIFARDYFRMIVSKATLDPKRKRAFYTDQVMSLLYKAEQSYLRKDVHEVDVLLQDFKNSWEQLNASSSVSTQIMKGLLADERRLLSHVLPEDDLYSVKQLVRDLWGQYFIDASDIAARVELLREELMEVYDLLVDGNITVAKTAFLNYVFDLQGFIRERDFSFSSQSVLQERYLIFNFLYNQPSFYEREFFRVMSIIEQEILYSMSDKVKQDEYRIYFLHDKLRMLSRLITLVIDGQLSLDKAMDLGEKLIQESEQYKADTGFEIASSPYIQQKIDEYKLLLEFFGSLEFEASHYQFQKQVFDAYVASKNAYQGLQEYLKSLETHSKVFVPNVNLNVIERDIAGTFEKNGFFVSELESFGDPGRRLFSIGQIVYKNGKPFSANFDRETGVIYEIDFGDRFISSGKTFENLVLLLETKESGVYEEETVSDEIPSSSLDVNSFINAIAIQSVKKQVEQAEMVVSDEQIQVIDLTKNHFYLVNVQDVADKDVMFSFDYLFDVDEVSNIVIGAGEEKQPLDGKYKLDTVLEAIRKETE